MNKWIYRFVLSLYALTTPSSVCYSQVVMHSSLDTVVARAKTTQESIIGFKKTVVPSYLRSGGDEEKELVEDFYLKDHLGNNRVVANASGQVEQVNHYYPYGGLMAGSPAPSHIYRCKHWRRIVNR